MASRLLKSIMGQSAETRRANAQRVILRHLAKVGGTVFGPVEKGRRREFFCLDARTWVWHEEWVDERGKYRTLTTRYDVYPNAIPKSQGTNSYQHLKGAELRNFKNAVKAYQRMAHHELDQLAHA
jgi:hypothetical protein